MRGRSLIGSLFLRFVGRLPLLRHLPPLFFFFPQLSIWLEPRRMFSFLFFRGSFHHHQVVVVEYTPIPPSHPPLLPNARPWLSPHPPLHEVSCCQTNSPPHNPVLHCDINSPCAAALGVPYSFSCAPLTMDTRSLIFEFIYRHMPHGGLIDSTLTPSQA